MAKGLIMTRFGAAAAIAIYWLFLICSPALAQSGKDLARKADDSIVCDGGSRVEGKCSCPAGFDLLPASANAAGSGTCVKTDAENCLGGQMTVAGTCFCSGRVTMSDESYTLELVGGKCIPKRCPEHTYLRDGKCVASNDKGFGFTCRTGYIPDEANPGTATTGLHCVPDPAFCDPHMQRRDGSCPEVSAIAIDCFEATCVCRDPHADWVNYLCQCADRYRNVNGACVSVVAKPGAPTDASDELAQRHGCAHGMVRAHRDCVPSSRRYNAGGLLDYYLRWRANRFRAY
jgi:hypothetical protein